MKTCSILTLLGLVAAVQAGGSNTYRPVRSEGGSTQYTTGNWAAAMSSSQEFDPETGETTHETSCRCMDVGGSPSGVGSFRFEEQCLCDACGECEPLETLKREHPEYFETPKGTCGCVDDPEGVISGSDVGYRSVEDCECQECGNCVPAPAKSVGSSSGDPHFMTWTGDKYDYHGECDLVLVHTPSFANGLGLRVHIRTTRVKYFSFIEKVAVQIGNDVLEFDNDVENFFINGAKVEPNRKHHKTTLGGFVVNRLKKSISIRLHQEGRYSPNNAKIDLHARENGFPAVIVDGGNSNVFKGSLGLLGDWSTGKKLGRDGKEEFVIDGPMDDASPFAMEWQVRDTEPMLFQDARFPQFPAMCKPPVDVPGTGRLGESLFRKEAEEACAHWKRDFEDCVFDVMATRDVMVATEGHIEHVE